MIRIIWLKLAIGLYFAVFVIELVGDVSNDDVYAAELLNNIRPLLTGYGRSTAKATKST